MSAADTTSAPQAHADRLERRTLPADVARCSGYEMDDGTMAAGCVHCLRRTDRSFFPQAAWMAPCIEVPRIACPMRIAKGYVFTAERAGEVAADMAALRKALGA